MSANIPEGAIRLTMADGVTVAVPDSLTSMTNYVLQEQGDYFEDEIKFLRKLIQPGQVVVDVGANLGVYTLSLAKCVGDSGRVVAFEPAPHTALLLRASIEANGYSNVDVEECALSDTLGELRFAIENSSELNRVLEPGESSDNAIVVKVSTLDHIQLAHQLHDVYFLKLDAEGQEESIIKGGERLLRNQSPIVMMEIAHGESINASLVDRILGHGYNTYRLLPGFDILVPLQADERAKPFLLNVFCMKPDRAEQLHRQGWLAENPSEPQLADDQWYQAFADSAYVLALEDKWLDKFDGNSSEDAITLRHALGCYNLAKNANNSADFRAGAALRAYRNLKRICSATSNDFRRSTFARVAREVGERLDAVETAKEIVQHLSRGNRLHLKEPFFVLESRYEDIDPTDNLERWLMSAAAEFLVKNRMFSSYFGPAESIMIYEHVMSLGFANAEIRHSLNLAKQLLSLRRN